MHLLTSMATLSLTCSRYKTSISNLRSKEAMGTPASVIPPSPLTKATKLALANPCRTWLNKVGKCSAATRDQGTQESPPWCCRTLQLPSSPATQSLAYLRPCPHTSAHCIFIIVAHTQYAQRPAVDISVPCSQGILGWQQHRLWWHHTRAYSHVPGLLAGAAIKPSLQENINPSLNANNGINSISLATLGGPGKPAPFDLFTDLNPFTMKVLDAYVS